MEVAGRHASNRLVSLLEGGYDLKGLSLSAAAHVARLMRVKNVGCKCGREVHEF